MELCTKDEARRCVRPPVLWLGASAEITKHQMGPLKYETGNRSTTDVPTVHVVINPFSTTIHMCLGLYPLSNSRQFFAHKRPLTIRKMSIYIKNGFIIHGFHTLTFIGSRVSKVPIGSFRPLFFTCGFFRFSGFQSFQKLSEPSVITKYTRD